MSRQRSTESARRVLLIEDMVDDAQECRQRLRAVGFQVEVATDGVEAINLLKRQKFDLLPAEVLASNGLVAGLSGYQFSLFLESALNALSAQIAILDETGTIIAVNKSWRSFVGIDPLAGRNCTEGADYFQVCTDAFSKGMDAADAIAKGIRQVLRDKTHEFYLEYSCQHQDQVRWYVARVARVPGKTAGSVVIQHADSTERRKSEEELENVRRRNELILNSVCQGICGIDLEGRVTFVNRAALEMTGYRAEEVLGKSVHSAIHHSRLDKEAYAWDACPIHKALRMGSTLSLDSESFWRKDGSSFPVHISATPTRESKNTTAAVITFRDISQEKTLQRHLLQAQKLESLGHLASGIAHEINTPAQYVGDNVRFLRDSFQELHEVLRRVLSLVPETSASVATERDQINYLAEEIPQAIGQSLEGLDRVSEIVRAMKEFSHPGHLEKAPTDINKAIKNSIMVSRNEWKNVAEVITEFDGSLPLVPCLEAELKQVFLNLIVNAAQAIEEAIGNHPDAKGTITVRTSYMKEWVEIKIADTGKGITTEVAARIFDPFFTTKEVGKGTGQGLAIAHDVIVQKHGGTIDVTSRPGKGATFSIRLPAA